MTHNRLKIENLSSGYSDKTIVHNLNLEMPEGKITAVVGANASGKSTFLRTLARLLKPQQGHVFLNGQTIETIAAKKRAQTIGVLPQTPTAPEGITVADLVGRGRYPYHSLFTNWNADDNTAVADALVATEIVHLADKAVDELSGGQRQRVFIAMALAQQTDILLLDEPTTFLDINHQLEILDLLTKINQKNATTIVMVLHDLNLACRYCDYIIALCDGHLHSFSTPDSFLTEKNVSELYQIDSHIITDPVSGRPMMIPASRYHHNAASQSAAKK